MDAAVVIAATPVLIAGNMCDARVWTAELRAVLPQAIDADTAGDDTIAAMASRALAQTSGALLPIGFSMGGIVALAMARQAPQRIAGLVLLDTNAAADRPERAAVRQRQQADVRAGRLSEVITGELIPHYLAAENSRDDALLALVLDMALALGEDVFVAQSEALRTRPDLRDVLPGLAVPVLIACGAADAVCPPALHRDLALSAQDARLQIIAGAGHMLPIEQPARLAAAIGAWRAAV